MNNVVGINAIRFITLLLVQVVICNNINFLGYINPYIYIIFIFLFPIRDSRLVLLLVSFLLGMLVDMFSDSGGVHAAAAVCRPAVKLVFPLSNAILIHLVLKCRI